MIRRGLTNLCALVLCFGLVLCIPQFCLVAERAHLPLLLERFELILQGVDLRAQVLVANVCRPESAKGTLRAYCSTHLV